MGVANRNIRDSDGVALPLLEVLGGENLSHEEQAGAIVVANLPAGTEIFNAVAEGGAAYYSFSPIASANAPGYLPEDARVIEGPIRDLVQKGLSFYIASGASVHIIYYRENQGR